VVFYDDAAKTTVQSNVFASPSVFFFTASSSSLSGSFLAYGSVGSFFVSVVLQGASAAEYSAAPTRRLNLVATVSTAPLPVISSAEFDSTGQRITVLFETPTDFAVGVTGGLSVWKCDLVLSFLGASSSSCSWSSSTQIAVMLSYDLEADVNLVVGDPVYLLPGVLNGYCYADACTDSFAPSSHVNTTVVSDFIQPEAIVKVPSKIGNCESLLVDPTQSTGNVGRDWTSVVWLVSAADGGDASAIQSLLSEYGNTSSVITIDASLLRQTTYTISLGLKNFLQDSSSAAVFAAVQTEVVAEEASLFVQISGSSYESRVRSKILSRTVSSLLTVCLSGSITTVTPDVSVAWTVHEVSATNNLIEKNVVSTSSNPNVFKTSPYTFNVGSKYQITATSTAVWDNSEISETKSFEVYFKRGDVAALINGYKNASVQYHQNTLLLLDGSRSKDFDDPEASLSYQWTCKSTNLENFGANCFSQRTSSELTSSSVSIPALSFAENDHFEVTLTVESTVAGVVRIKTAKTFVEVVGDASLNMNVAIEKSGDVYSPQTDLIINSFVESDSSSGLTATWSLQTASDVSLTSPNVMLAPLSRSFSLDEVTNGLNFPLGIRSNVLTGGVEYVFRLRVEDAGGSAIYREVSVIPNAPPIGGSFAVRPKSGVAFVTKFSFSARNWGDDPDDYPIEYLFVYQDASSFDSSLPFDQVGVRTSKFTASTLLPEGQTTDTNTIACSVFVSDYWGAMSSRATSVIVSEGDLISEYTSIISGRRLDHHYEDIPVKSLYIPLK
jgi:hypothetical protein